MSEFTLRQLEYLIAVIESGSVSRAAKELHISAGAISQGITDLETSLGVQLTIRRPARGVAATPAGRIAVGEARAILEKTRDLRELSRVMRGELRGPLRLGCFSTLSPWILPPIATYFDQKHPGVNLDLIDGSSDALQEMVLSGSLDAALVLFRHLVAGVESVEIVPLQLQVVLPSEHPLASLEAIPLQKLRDEPALLIDLQPARDLVEQVLASSGFKPHVRWRFKNVETIRSMVARGLGFSVIMGRPAGDRSYDGLPLVYRRIADDIPHNALTLVYPKRTRPTARVRTLIEFCQQEFIGQGGQLARWNSA